MKHRAHLRTFAHYTTSTANEHHGRRTHATSKKTSGGTGTSRKCHLFAIPPELRLLIYEAYFSTYELDTDPPLSWSDLQPALLSTCLQIRTEGVKAYRTRLGEINSVARERFRVAQDEAERRFSTLTDRDQMKALFAEVADRETAWQKFMSVYECEAAKAIVFAMDILKVETERPT